MNADGLIVENPQLPKGDRPCPDTVTTVPHLLRCVGLLLRCSSVSAAAKQWPVNQESAPRPHLLLGLVGGDLCPRLPANGTCRGLPGGAAPRPPVLASLVARQARWNHETTAHRYVTNRLCCGVSDET